MSIEARILMRSPFPLNVDLRAGTGITVLLGPSGAGKTLTLNCIAGFTKPDAGRILINQQIYFDAEANLNLPPERRRCGYIFQDDALFPHLTVRGNLRFAAACLNSTLNTRKRIQELLEIFELKDLADRKPAQLSGGQRQRASLARILVADPQILLLDEPTRGLDARLRQAFYETLRDTQSRLNIPVLVVTHDLEECLALADEVCLLQSGVFLQQGPVTTVFDRPATLEAARFLGLYAIVPAEILALDPGRNTSRLRLLGQEIASEYLPGHLLGDRGYLCVRSSEITVDVPSTSDNELLLSPTAVQPSPRGVRLTFAPELSVEVAHSRYEILRSLDRLAPRVPATAVSFLTA